MKLPQRLRSEPILDAIFEIRFSAKTPVASIFPGVLFAQLGGEKVERLPGADIPDSMRAADPNLRAIAVQKVHWGEFYVLVGDESLAIGCKLPYPGWAKFKPAIERVLGALDSLNLIDLVSRYSLKYADMLPTKDSSEAISMLDLDIQVGGHKLTSETFQLRVELVRDKFVHIVQSVSAAQIMTVDDAKRRQGTVLDIDSVCNIAPAIPFKDFLARSPEYADEIHQANKVLFFQCLKDTTIESLGPEYE